MTSEDAEKPADSLARFVRARTHPTGNSRPGRAVSNGRRCAEVEADFESRAAQDSLASGGSPRSAGPQPCHSRLTSLTNRRSPAGHRACYRYPAVCPGQFRLRVRFGRGNNLLPPTRSPDRHQEAQHDAHGYDQQPTSAVFHTNRSSPLPAYRTGLGRSCPCPADSYQHSRTGRCLLPEPTFRPQEVGPKHGTSQRVPMVLPFGTRLSTECLDPTIRLSQGTLPKAPAPADNQLCGPKRPSVVAPGTVRRQSHCPGCPKPLNLPVYRHRT
jgi:hypothetical protein